MYLYRSGELNNAESKELREHIAGCTDCKVKLESIVLDAEKIRFMLNPVPEIPDSDRFADDVMSLIPSVGRPSTKLLKPAPARLAWPAFKFALAAVLCAMLGTFVYQSLIFFEDVRRTEEQFALLNESARREGAGYSVDIAALLKSETYAQLLQTAGYFPQSGTTITLSMEMIDAMRSFLDRPTQARRFAGTQFTKTGTQDDVRELVQSARFRVFATSQM